jgi:hypothetical protein
VRGALVACMLAAALHSSLVVLTRIDAIQRDVAVMVSSLAAGDTARLEFDRLHLLSTRLMMFSRVGGLALV